MIESWEPFLALLGVVVGALVGFATQRYASRQARRQRRREDFISAAADFATAASQLIQVEYNRAKRRLSSEDGELRERARQDAYDQRTQANSALYRLRLVSDPERNAALIASAEGLIRLCREVSAQPKSMSDLGNRNRAARAALDQVITDATSHVLKL
jgi:hypothetical protein